MVFRTDTIATIDHCRQSAEIVVAAAETSGLRAAHGNVQRGQTPVTLELLSASRVQTALTLILRGQDELLYGWQLRLSALMPERPATG